jgi:hypothetical protein
MNKGSTIDLAVAVHKAGGYPSLCSWTYNRNETLFRRDLTRFADVTQSNRVHVSFEFDEYDNQVTDVRTCQEIINDLVSLL